MIVPGHVVFLWGIIHQHFTLAFLKHISTCRWNKPSWSAGKKVAKKTLKFTLKCLLPFCPVCVQLAATHQTPNTEHKKQAALFRLFLQSRRLSLKTAYSFIEVPGAARIDFFFFFHDAKYFVRVWRVFGAFLRRLDHLASVRRSASSCSAPGPWSCHGGRRKAHTSHLRPMQTPSCVFVQIKSFLKIFWMS